MAIRNLYYQLNKDDFTSYLNSLRSHPDTIHLLNDGYFYHVDRNINLKLLEVHQLQWQIDTLISSFSTFGRNQLIQSFLLDEIEATNLIESIPSTRHDIFHVMRQVEHNNITQLTSIVNGYRLLLENGGQKINSHDDIRKIYDELIGNSLNDSDRPDGTYYRKEPVYINDGTRNIHTGITGEENIEQAMDEFLSVYNSSLDIYEKMILAHFLIETIHPYYDGNGRLGRFLFSNELYHQTGSSAAFLISGCLAARKSRYYRCFRDSRDIHEFGCVNEFVSGMLDILISGFREIYEELIRHKQKIDTLSDMPDLTGSESEIYHLLAEGTILSYIGLSQAEIKEELGISKRTLIYALNHFREKELLEETKIGRIGYIRLKEELL